MIITHEAQLIAFSKYREKLKNFALSNVGAIDSRAALTQHMSVLTDEELRGLCEELALLGPKVLLQSSSEILI